MTLSVSDSTDTASFLGFDIEMAKLTNILASEASQIVVLPKATRILNWYCYFCSMILNIIADVSRYSGDRC